MALQVLIVEDEPLIALHLQTIIEESGHTVAGMTDDMRGALDIALVSEIDVAIMDIELATMPDGVETARRLRVEHGVRSLFVSANINNAMRSRTADLDPVGFIDKPFVDTQIVRALSPIA